MNLFRLVFELLLIYVLYKLVFELVIPVYQNTKAMKRKMEAFRNSGEATKSATHNSRPAIPEEDYIEYEEVRSDKS